MRYKYLLILLLFTAMFSCRKKETTIPPQIFPPVLLKDISVASLPAPFYHFEYDAAGKINFASIAAGFKMYNVSFNGARLSELVNNTMVNKDKLQYSYDNTGRIDAVRYINEAGTVFKICFFTYVDNKLASLEWVRIIGTSLPVEREIKFVYYPDGNLMQMTDDRRQVALIFVFRYEQYDNKANTDAFTLIHNDNDDNDHLLLLPGLPLQRNNPGKVIRTGDTPNYSIDYTYTYNEKSAPLTRSGEITITSGTGAGQKFQSKTAYSYY